MERTFEIKVYDKDRDCYVDKFFIDQDNKVFISVGYEHKHNLIELTDCKIECKLFCQ